MLEAREPCEGESMRDRARKLLPAALGVVLASDLVGGVWDVAAGRSAPADAWGPGATLCAPWPMIAFQAVAVAVAVRSRGKPGRVAAGLLFVACAVSLVSGFFDGQLARPDLSRAEVGFQAVLLAATGVLGGWAAVAAFGRTRAPQLATP
jgi:hypothetical protein